MSKPLVSVIMLVYNNVQFLKAAIDSVLEQSYSNWELLINDDGSTDGAWELIQTLAELDSRIKPQQNAPKLGIPKNRKSAYDRSSGELVCHLDGDDALFPWSLETMVNHMEKDPDVAIAYSDFAWVDASGKVFSLSNSPRSSTVFSCKKLVTTSFKSSLQIRVASGLCGVASPLIST